mgnify:CR=1 FL=1
MSKVDAVDNAHNLLRVVEFYIGKDSATYADCVRLLKEGHSASEIAGKLKEFAQEAWADE